MCRRDAKRQRDAGERAAGGSGDTEVHVLGAVECRKQHHRYLTVLFVKTKIA